MAEPNPRGRFVWHELLTTNPDAAAAFYPSVTGWGVTTYPKDPSYRMWTVGGVPVGGLMMLPDAAKQMGAPPHWLPYVGVPDVDASVRQAASLGARTFMAAQDIPEIGRFAVLADPQGAVFAIFRAAGQPMGHEGEANMGEFSWHELATTDGPAAFAFYQAMFGWAKTEAMDMGPDGVYQMFGRHGITLGGIYKGGPTVPRPRWLCYVRVPNADSASALATRGGAQIVSGPMDVPGGGRVCQCRDPQGAVFAVHAVPAAAVKPAATKPAAAKRPAAKSAKGPAKAKAKRKSAGKKATRKSAPKRGAATRSKAKGKSRTKARAKPRTNKKRATKRTPRRRR